MSSSPASKAPLDQGQLFRDIFDASPDAVVVIDERYEIVLASPSASVLFGYAPEELLGQRIDVLVPDSRKASHERHLRHYFSSPHARAMGVGLELTGRQRDGVEFSIQVSLTPVKVGDEYFAAAHVRDARERQRVVDRVNAVNEIIKHLLAGSEMREIFPMVAKSARQLCNSDAAWIAMPKTATQFEIVSVDGKGTELLLGVLLSGDTSRSAEVMRSGRPDVIENLSTAENVPPGVIELDLGPGVYVPFVAAQRRLGTLVLGRVHGEPPFHAFDVAFAETFAAAAATAIEMGSARAEIDRLNIVAEDERIARDLHDTVIQELFALGMSLQALGSFASGVVGDRISAAVETLDDVIRQIRNTIFRLPNSQAAPSGLREELLRVADRYHHEQGVLPRIAFIGPVDVAVSELVSDHLLHVFAEALSNVARHAYASKIDVVLSIEGEWLSLSLVDDGVGVGDGPSAGNGIRNMSIRAENLGGTFNVRRREPQGSILEWRVPLSSAVAVPQSNARRR